MQTPRQTLRTALCASAILLVGTLLVRTAFAEEASSGAHGDGKGSAAPAEASGDKSSSQGAAGEGAKAEPHPSRGDDGKTHQGGPADHGETPKDSGPSIQTGKDSSNADLHVEPLRRLDKTKSKPGGDNATLQNKQGFSRRLSPVPQAPNPVRNAIGVVVPAPAHVELHDAAHPPPVAPPRSSCDTCRPKHHRAIRQARDDQSPNSEPRYHAVRGKPWRDQRNQRDTPQCGSASDWGTDSVRRGHQWNDDPS